MDIEGAPGTRSTPRARRHVVWYLTTGGILAIAAVVGLAAFSGFARDSFSVGPARVSVAVSPTLRPTTTLIVSPFGSVSARTHVAPLSLGLSLDEIDLPQVEGLVQRGLPARTVLDGWVSDLRSGFVRAVARGLLAAFLAGAFVGWALKRAWREALASAVTAFLVPALLVGIAVASFEPEAFGTPSFRGAVTYAPSLIELVQRRAQKVESLRDQIGKLARDLASYYRAPQSFATGGDLAGTYRVLHVTDLHLDPVGLKLAEELAREFSASLVIDTGDINHFGSPVEASVVASQISTAVPQIFVPGNHDSPAVIAALDALTGVVVLDGESGSFDDLVVFGLGDPASAGAGVESNRGQLESLAAEEAESLREAIGSGEPTPAIVAVHNPAMAKYFDGLAQIVIAGHSHTPMLEQLDESWYLNSGTTGGIHFSRMRADPHIPHSASVLYFTAREPYTLVAVDQIEVYGLAGQSSLKRTVIDESLLP